MKFWICSLVCGLLGFGLMVAGIALVHVPSALCFAGLCLLAYSWRLDKVAAALKRNGQRAGQQSQSPLSPPPAAP
ncbi:hypothetical protein EDF72_1738 [Delftia acidovorans]|jgi:hypothetical protein|uniref:hypothetical protein n=1 Tax=Delftia acidovorans TaxID=80866 RepID=UPI000F4B69E0|nr:hypothetical protein [Delftia acidovorans]ROR02604.1 hypothetical protein EDF72_1738 [Delftia acidovorans]